MSQETTKKCWLKNISWKKKVDPVIGYALFGGAMLLAVVIGVICCL